MGSEPSSDLCKGELHVCFGLGFFGDQYAGVGV